ncbi:ABC transporter substrate-binding protein [Micromonospora sp. NPDC005163]
MPDFSLPFQRRRRGTAMLAVTAVVSLALSGCAGGSDSGSSVQASKEECHGDSLSLTQSTTGFLYLPSYVAEHAGYYKDQGLDVSIKDLGGGSENVAAVVSGSADVALTAYSSIVSAREAGAPVVAIGSLMDQYASNVVISKAAAARAGVTEDSSSEEKIRALKGLKLGITSPGSGTDQLFHYLFRQVGLDADKDATLLPIGSGSPMIAAFKTGKIDGFSLSSPTSDLAARQGGVMLFNLSKGEYKPLEPFLYIVAVANSRTLDKKSRVLTCFSKAIGHALQLIHDDPKKAAEVARPAFADIDEDLYQSAFDANVAAYPESPVIEKADAQKVFDFLADFEGKRKKATVDNTVNDNLAKAAE